MTNKITLDINLPGGTAVPKKGAAPTPEEFIAHIARRVQEKGSGQDD